MWLRPGRPLLAGYAQRISALLACCAILVVVLGVIFAHQSKPDWFDRAVDAPIITWFSGHPGLGQWLISPGSLLPAGVLSATIVVACLLAGRLNGAILGAVAVPAADGLSDGLLKPMVHRTYLGVLTYPSGHATALFAMVATITVLLLIPPQRGRAGALRLLIPATAFVLATVGAIALIGLRFHYFSDTVAGAALGIGTVCGLALLVDSPAARRLLARANGQQPTVQPKARV